MDDINDDEIISLGEIITVWNEKFRVIFYDTEKKYIKMFAKQGISMTENKQTPNLDNVTYGGGHVYQWQFAKTHMLITLYIKRK